MATLVFSREDVLALQSMLDSDNQAQYESILDRLHIPKRYATDIGQLMLTAELVDQGEDLTSIQYDFDEVCTLKKHMRCQVGHVVSHLDSRSKESPRIKKRFAKFMNNVDGTVLVVDRSNLMIGEPNAKGKILINSIECRDLLNLAEFDAPPNMPLCDSFFYANEHVPDTNIFGSGYFIAHNTVVTAAHVLEQAFISKVIPEDLMFIRGHFAYESDDKTIEVAENQLYLLDQPKIMIRNQMRNGSKDGDMAWVKVKPYNQDKVFSFQWNGFTPKPVQDGDVYALGHGIGVPMKLSFGGVVTNGSYHDKATMFTCDINILPGSSGSPIFSSKTHQLVGIVSGLHEITTKVDKKNKCVSIEINMEGTLSGIATHIAPFSIL